jgi:hypothetical protein
MENHNWWEQAPLASDGERENWWEEAPLVEPPKAEEGPKPKSSGIGGYVADAITDMFKRAGGAALSGVASAPEAAQSGLRATVRSGAGGDPATVMPGGAFIPGIDTDEAINGPMTQQQRDRRELQAERAAWWPA